MRGARPGASIALRHIQVSHKSRRHQTLDEGPGEGNGDGDMASIGLRSILFPPMRLANIRVHADQAKINDLPTRHAGGIGNI